MKKMAKGPEWQELQNDLENGVGHYMAGVAERLLIDGLPVTSIYAHAVCDERSLTDDDAEGRIHFKQSWPSFKENTESFLHWAGTSGWCYRTVRKTAGADPSTESARWLNAGLLPDADRVAAFVSAVQVCPGAAGSAERPFYRTALDQLYDLVTRLRQYAPGPEHSPLAHSSYEARFTEVHGAAYRNRVIRALVSGDDRVLFLPIRNSELRALQHLLAYAEAIAPLAGPYDLAQSLAEDLCRRTPGDHRSVYLHDNARSMAARQLGLFG